MNKPIHPVVRDIYVKHLQDGLDLAQRDKYIYIRIPSPAALDSGKFDIEWALEEGYLRNGMV